MADLQNNNEKSEIRVFQLNDELAEFEELEINPEVKLFEILNTNIILYFLNPAQYQSFIWTGSSASTRMKFIAAERASNVRDSIGPAIKIMTVDEGDETMAFKILVGLEKPIEYEEQQTGPSYTGKAEDDALLEDLSLDRLVLLLEKVKCPEGYQREMIIEGKNIYGYHEAYKEYMGEIIKERKLYRLQESVPDGPYFAKDLIPRILMSYNRVVLVELLRNLSQEEIESIQEIDDKVKATKISEQPAPFTQ